MSSQQQQETAASQTASPTALLVIDTQTAMLDGGDGANPAYQHDEVIAHICELQAQARSAGATIIYMQHDSDPGETLEPETAGWRIHPALAPQSGDLVIRKRASGSFYETTLGNALASRGITITRLVITGLRTERCVDTTSRQAVSLGYDVILASDAHTTADGDTLTAAQIIAHTNENLDDFGNDAHVITVQLSEAILW
ncbi:MAG: cysteine hydrolase family protein [Ktedonobacterales bacterium]